MENSIIVQNFIEQIWNNKAFQKFDNFFHPGFKDHSLPPAFSPDREGMKKWIIETGKSFEHNTIIEEQVTEGDKSIVKIRMNLKHTGIWRDMQPTGKYVHAIGYRYFKLKDGKIIGHWGLIDGQGLENQLREASRGCKVAE